MQMAMTSNDGSYRPIVTSLALITGTQRNLLRVVHHSPRALSPIHSLTAIPNPTLNQRGPLSFTPPDLLTEDIASKYYRRTAPAMEHWQTALTNSYRLPTAPITLVKMHTLLTPRSSSVIARSPGADLLVQRHISAISREEGGDTSYLLEKLRRYILLFIS